MKNNFINIIIRNIKRFNSEPNFLLIIGFYLLPIISIIIQFLQLNLKPGAEFDKFFFNSDSVYMTQVCKDIIQNDAKLTDWIIVGAPEFFPTLILNYIICFLIGNYFISQLVYLIIQLITFNILSYILLKNFTEKNYALYFNGLINLLIIFVLHIKPFEYIFISSHHFGTYLNFLFTLLLLYKNSKNKLNNIFIILFIFISSFCNPIFLAYFVIPLIITNIIVSLIYKIYFLKINFIYLISGLSGFIIKKSIFVHENCNECINSYHTMDNIRFDAIKISLYHIKEFFISNSSIIQNLLAFISFSIPLFILLMIYIKREPFSLLFKKNSHFFILIIISILSTIFCFTFLPINPQFRHLYNLYFFALLVIPIILYFYLNKVHIQKIIFYSPLLFSLYICFINIDLDKKFNFDYYPKDIEYIDSILDKYNLKHGYTEWSYGNRLVYLSKNIITIIPFHDKTPLHWDINRDWIKKDPEFIINLDPKKLDLQYSKLIQKDNLSIYIL